MKAALLGLFALLALAGFVAGLYGFAQGLIVTDMSHQVPWGLWEALYIFCTGLSAGSFALSAVGALGVERFKPIARIAGTQAVVLLMVAPLFLLVSLGRPDRIYLVYTSPNPSSVISWGAYLLALYPILCAAYLYALMRRDLGSTPLPPERIAAHDARAKWLAIAGIPLAIMVHGYTGVLLGFVKRRPLWHTPLMPILFLTSAVLSGVGLLICVLVVLNRWTRHRTDPALLPTLSRLMLALLIVDLGFLSAEALSALYGRATDQLAAWTVLLEGFGGVMFVGVELVLGALVPIILLARWPNRVSTIVTSAVLIVGGVLAMRCYIMVGGLVVQPYGGAVGSYFPTGNEVLVTLGFAGVAGLLYAGAVRFLPLVPSGGASTPRPEAA